MNARLTEADGRPPEAYKVYYSPVQQLLVAHRAGELRYLAGHVHTNRTDGRLTPQGAVDLAVRTGANALAITDHDSVRPSLEAQDYTRKQGLSFTSIARSRSQHS